MPSSRLCRYTTLFRSTDERQRTGDAPPEAVWQVIETIGGERGWYSAAALWKIRGLMDQALGGYGLARGRKNEHQLRVNDQDRKSTRLNSSHVAISYAV